MKNRLYLSVLISIIIVLGWAIVSESVISDISSGIIRLHIIANSNSIEDQELKLKVRDRLLNEIDINNSKEVDLNKVEEICRDEVVRNGYNYDVKACFGKFYFPTKSYENISLPAGDYNAVRVLIGKNEGENWWCVMYPPLCFNGSGEGTIKDKELNDLKSGMKSDNYELIENDEIKIKPAFKIVEWWQEIRHGKS